MQLQSVLFIFLLSISAAFAQFGSAFFGATFPSGFVSPFSDLGAPATAMYPSNGQSNTGPILFPPSPESRDTSGVIVGASGYGFVPPGGKGVDQGRNLPPSFAASFKSSPFGSFFHL